MTGNFSTENRRHYETLGLAPGAGVREVKKQARMLLLRFHPDLNPQNREFCEEKTKGIAAAYTALLQWLRQSGDAEEAEAAAPAAGAALVFELSHRLFALPAAQVRGVLRLRDARLEDLSIVSGAFPYICGVFHSRGELVMLWNLHAQLGLREPAADSGLARAMLVHAECDDTAAGFLADAVHGMAECEQGAGGVLDTPHGHATVLDLRELLFGDAQGF
jgi:chemotaxis signal transduction protein